MEGGYSYDAGNDVEGIFPEDFRKYVRDHNLICHNTNYVNRFWFFRNKHQYDSVDREIAHKFASLYRHLIFVPEQCVVQFWRAEELTTVDDSGERRFRLTTRGQSFMLARNFLDKKPFGEGICSYRMKMVDIITGYGRGGGGVIGRVFQSKRMECTPNIGYYSYEEYSHRDLALSCHIKFSLAIPLSDTAGRSVGVLEIVSSNLVIRHCLVTLQDCVEYLDCCKDICEQYNSEDDSLEMPVSEIEEVMQLVGQSCCLVCAQTWIMCNRCSYLSTSKRLDCYRSAFCEEKYFEHGKSFPEEEYLFTLKKGEGVVGKAAASSHNLVYCDDVSQFSITEYPLAHFARHHKLTSCFAICLRSNRTGNRIYVLEFFLNPSKVNGKGLSAMLVPIVEGMRKNFRTFKLASGEEIGDNLSVQVIDVRFPENFEILEIGKQNLVDNYTVEMDLIHNDVNVVNTIEEGVAMASLDKQNNFEISGGKRGGKLAADVADAVFLPQAVRIEGLAIDNGESMGGNIDEQRIAIASLEKEHNNATIVSDERGEKLAIAIMNSDISLQPLAEANVIRTEENNVGPSEECIINSSKLPPRRGGNGIDISLEELEEVRGMKREDAAKRLKVSVSTFKHAFRDYQISRWPPRKKNIDQPRSGNSTQIDSMKELGGSVQNENLVTIKAKYGDNFIKFKLSASSGVDAFNQQVSKRLKIEAGSYVVKYQDDNKDWILVACDDDLQDYISSSASLGQTTLRMLLEHI